MRHRVDIAAFFLNDAICNVRARRMSLFMKRRIARWFLLGALAAQCLFGRPQAALAQADSSVKAASRADQEKEDCTRNLKIIYDAIKAYENDNKDLPNWLSDLVPQYLNDANILICPACRRTGHLESAEVADPKIPSSYLYEFSPVPLGDAAPNSPTRTRREWRRLQLAVAGPMVPLVRCRHHKAVLNLAYDGHVYESPVDWQSALPPSINPADLTPEKLFADHPAPAAPSSSPGPLAAAASSTTSAASTKPKSGAINLTKFYNALLTDSWQGGPPGDDLATLPEGRHKYAGVQFDVRGIIQLRSKSLSAGNFPVTVKSIRLRRKCKVVHFLQAAGFGSAADEGRKIGSYLVRYATNQMRLEIPIYYGYDVRDWHTLTNEPTAPRDLTVAWTGENEAGKQDGRRIRLFMTTWTNIAPDLEIDRIDYTSTMTGPAPFLLAITAD
jgi:hypothetical protein